MEPVEGSPVGRLDRPGIEPVEGSPVGRLERPGMEPVEGSPGGRLERPGTEPAEGSPVGRLDRPGMEPVEGSPVAGLKRPGMEPVEGRPGTLVDVDEVFTHALRPRRLETWVLPFTIGVLMRPAPVPTTGIGFDGAFGVLTQCAFFEWVETTFDTDEMDEVQIRRSKRPHVGSLHSGVHRPRSERSRRPRLYPRQVRPFFCFVSLFPFSVQFSDGR